MTPSIEEYRLIPLTQGQFAKVDAEDYEFINQWKWCAHWDRGANSYYAKRQSSKADGQRTLLMHRVVLGLAWGDGRQGDHINGDTLDNRKSNLRIANSAENGANRGANKNNASGFKGVSWHTGGKAWRAQIRINRRAIHLGMFKTAEEAYVAYREAAKIHHHQFIKHS